MRSPFLLVALAIGMLPAALLAQKPARDSAFAAMQARGKHVMGVDQYTSAHRFDSLADGGRIVLRRDVADSAGVAASLCPGGARSGSGRAIRVRSGPFTSSWPSSARTTRPAAS